MKEILLQIMGVVLLIGTSVTPAWDMPKDASCEAQNAVYAEEAKEIEEVDENTDSVDESGDESLEYIGTFEMTAYEWTGSPCANGNYPQTGYTVACNSLPLGTQVYIEGVGYRVVEDRGAEWHSDYWMDLYLGDVDACYEWGVRTVEVYIVR